MEGQGTLVVFGLIFFSFVIFVIYFIFKVLQFVIQAINLYKKILNSQDAMLRILLDIRDNTKKYENLNSYSEEIFNTSSSKDDGTSVCENCKAVVSDKAKFCTNCGSHFE